MLFDTSSPGRKNAVRVIFASLAILMGGGLVLFGIGSSTSGGGLFDAFSGNGSNTTSISDQARKDADSAQAALTKNPKDLEAARQLAKARLAIATQESFDQTGQVNPDNEDAQAQITAATNAWTKYLALAPAKPDAGTAIGYAAFFAYPGVSQYDKAARALEANLVTRPPSAGLYAQLAIYYLAAGNNEKYRDARTRSLDAATSDTRRAAIKKQLDDIAADFKKQQDAYAKQQADQAGEAAGSTTPKLPTLPTLQ